MAVWLVPLGLPLAGLALLLARPQLDVRWEHDPSHFWLVLGIGGGNVLLGLVAGDAARRRGDARLVLVSLAFMASAGFLGLHALATPGVLLEGANAGFVIATPIGLLVASALAALSALEVDARRGAAVVRRQRALGLALLGVLGLWGAASLASVPPLDEPLAAEEADGLLGALAAVAVGLYAFAAVRYLALYRRRAGHLVLALVAAFVLLSEAAIAVALGRSWHASWWEWHVLMAVAFGLVAWHARAAYRREGSVADTFGSLYLECTLDLLDRRSAERMARLVETIDRGGDIGPVVAGLRATEGLSDDEARLLERAAHEIRALDDLFRPYLSPQLAERLRGDPGLAELGGAEREISVLFADLEGFTAYSEQRSPTEVISMLNAYWATAVPAVIEAGGTIERFAGDAIMAVFNAAGEQDDHALRALRAGVGLQRAADRIAAAPDWPRFRVGVNTGRAVVGNVGSREQRSFTAIGDTTNLAARLQAHAEPGQIVLGEATYAQVEGRVWVDALGALQLKGKSEPVQAFLLVGVDGVDSGITTAKGE